MNLLLIVILAYIGILAIYLLVPYQYQTIKFPQADNYIN